MALIPSIINNVVHSQDYTQPYAFLSLKSPPSLAAEEAAMFYFTPCFELV